MGRAFQDFLESQPTNYPTHTYASLAAKHSQDNAPHVSSSGSKSSGEEVDDQKEPLTVGRWDRQKS